MHRAMLVLFAMGCASSDGSGNDSSSTTNTATDGSETNPSETGECDQTIPSGVDVATGTLAVDSSGGKVEICSGGEGDVNASNTTLWVHSGGVLNLNAADCTVYAEDGATVNVNASGGDFYGNPDDFTAVLVGVDVTDCDVTLTGGGC